MLVCGVRVMRTSLHLFVVLGHVVRPDAPQELYVVVAVELRHLLLCRLVRALPTKTRKIRKKVNVCISTARRSNDALILLRYYEQIYKQKVSEKRDTQMIH